MTTIMLVSLPRGHLLYLYQEKPRLPTSAWGQSLNANFCTNGVLKKGLALELFAVEMSIYPLVFGQERPDEILIVTTDIYISGCGFSFKTTKLKNEKSWWKY